MSLTTLKWSMSTSATASGIIHPDRPGDLDFRLPFPGGRVEQPGLGVDAGLGQQLGVHDEPPGQQHGRHGGDGQHRVDGDHDGDQDAEVELGEVGLQRLPAQLELGQLDAGIGQLDRAHDQEVVAAAADDLAQRHGQHEGEGVHARADRGAGEGHGKLPEQQRRHAVGQADGGAGEDPAVDHALVDPQLGEHLQRDRGQHGVDRRQQDRHRQHPHGEEVPGHAGLEVGDPRGGGHGDHAARQQQRELHQVGDVPGGLRQRVARSA